MEHSHKKQKDSLETRAVLLIILLELEISGVAVQSIHRKTAENGNFCEELLSENDFEAVLATFCCYAMVPTLLRQFKRSLQIKKSIAYAPRVLRFAE